MHTVTGSWPGGGRALGSPPLTSSRAKYFLPAIVRPPSSREFVRAAAADAAVAGAAIAAATTGRLGHHLVGAVFQVVASFSFLFLLILLLLVHRSNTTRTVSTPHEECHGHSLGWCACALPPNFSWGQTSYPSAQGILSLCRVKSPLALSLGHHK